MIDLKGSTKGNIVMGERRPYKGANVFSEEYYKAYLDFIRKTLHNVPPFEIRLAGVCASASEVFVQGFDGGTINKIRVQLIKKLLIGYTETGKLKFADNQPETVRLTLARYRRFLRDPAKFAEFIDRTRNAALGSFVVKRLFLVREYQPNAGSYTVSETFNLPTELTEEKARQAALRNEPS
jgi:hypothetical protein